MSLVICAKCPKGVVLTSDSRRTFVRRTGECVPGSDERVPGYRYFTIDDEPKLLTFAEPHQWIAIGVYGYLPYGRALIKTMRHEIEASLPSRRLLVREYAQQVSDAFVRWIAGSAGVRLIGIVAGYDAGEADNRVFVVDTEQPKPVEQHAGGYGLTIGGMQEFVTRLLFGFDARLVEDANGYDVYARVPLAAMSLDDCATFAAFLVSTTAGMQRFQTGVRGVGGAIHRVTVARDVGMRRDTLPCLASAPGPHEIGTTGVVTLTAPPDGVRVSSYTVMP